jgi:hypothetical protein
MAAEPSWRAIEPSLQNAERPTPPSLREVTIIVGWFFGWPVVICACIPFLKQANTLCLFLLGAGSFLWLVSCYGIYDTLFTMAEARWPKATTVRKILGFIAGILRAFPRSPLLVSSHTGTNILVRSKKSEAIEQ